MRTALLVLLLAVPVQAQTRQEFVDVRETVYEMFTEAKIINREVKRNADDIDEMKDSLKRLEAQANQAEGAWKLLVGLTVILGLLQGIGLIKKVKGGS
jgi:predicted nuclease with TOPRIM domain